MKTLKWILLGLGGLFVLLLAAVVIFVATFDPNTYKPQIVGLVKQRTGRTLTLDKKISLTIFPNVGVAIGKATLSEPNSPRAFAHVDDARVAVALLPLLSKQVIVDRVTLRGLAVDLVRHKDGRKNFDDLVGQTAASERPAGKPEQAPAGSPLAIDVGSIAIENATIGWRDERDGTNVRLSNLSLKTGRLASGVPGRLTFAAHVDGAQPKAKLEVSLDTGYQLDFATQAVKLSSLDAKAAGDAQGFTGIETRLKGETVNLDPKGQRITLSRVELSGKSKDGLEANLAIPGLLLAPDRAESQAITADLKLATQERNVTAKMQVAPLAVKGKQFEISRLDVDLAVKQGDRTAQGKLATPLLLDLTKQRAQLPSIMGELTVSGKDIPNKSLKATVQGGAHADWAARNANIDLVVKLDDSNIQSKLAVLHWSQPAVNFTLVADRLNIDRYLPPSQPAAAPGGPAPGGPAPGGGTPPEQPFDLSPLKTLDAAGDVQIGALQVSNIKAERVALKLKANAGRLDISPISANLYQGTLAGSAAVNANDNGFALKQKLASVSIGLLLHDAANKDLLEGKASLNLDVTTVGTTVSALKKALAGTASIAVRDGAIKGIDIPGTIRKAKGMLGSKTALEEEARGGAKTDFSELTASFTIKNGVARNDDLQMKSPLLRLTGKGDINIGDSTMDYTTQASVVATATGQGGKELADVAGLTVPVRVTGPLASPKYNVDIAALATGIAKGALQHELERRLGGGPGSQPGGSGGSGGDIGSTLRGIFGKPK